MRQLPLLLLLVLGMGSCKKSDAEYSPTAESLLGEWRYVGIFDHRVDYMCTICPSFDFEKSLYRFALNTNGRMSTNINLLVGQGFYQFGSTEQISNFTKGDFRVTNLSFLNKPFQTLADTQFIQNFESVRRFTFVDAIGQPYDQLLLTFGENYYLLFVRKR